MLRSRTGRWLRASRHAAATNRSTGRFPDGADTDSNCDRFPHPGRHHLAARTAPSGITNIKVASVAGFASGQTIMIDAGANPETAVIAAVGTAGGTQ